MAEVWLEQAGGLTRRGGRPLLVDTAAFPSTATRPAKGPHSGFSSARAGFLHLEREEHFCVLLLFAWQFYITAIEDVSQKMVSLKKSKSERFKWHGCQLLFDGST